VEIPGIERWCREAVEPTPTGWRFPPPDGDDDLIAVGGDLKPGTILRAYRHGLFPMKVNRRVLGWWSPVERAIIPLGDFAPSRSLRRSVRRYQVSVDRAFRTVMASCADPRRAHAWITPAFIEAYSGLHELGWAHSVEAWTDDGRLAGGLYGVRIGRFFAGESMVHHERDASKVALVALVALLRASGATLLDVQWLTPHLASLGAVAIPRAAYLERLRDALDVEREGSGGPRAPQPMG
jgi:leucyl/phenylalanyl-tRNA--protein transferase